MNQEKNKFAVILCGGKGTRLGDIGKKYAKTLLKVQGREILWYVINALKKNKFNNIVLPLGYKSQDIRSFLKKYKNFGINIMTENTGINTNISKRLYMVRKKITSKNFLLLNGDAIFETKLNFFFNQHSKGDFDITFLSSKFVYPYGTIGVVNNHVVDFKRNLSFDALHIRKNYKYYAYNYTGMSVIKTSVFKKKIQKFKNNTNFEKSLYSEIIKNKNCRFASISGFWHSIDNVKDLTLVNNDYKNKKFIITKKLKNKLSKNR